MNGSIKNRCGSAGLSSAAIITLNGNKPVVTVGPQVGYSGVSLACNRTPVTFYAQTNYSFGCISGYSWTYPSGWTNPVQSGNSITLTPSGNSTDAGTITGTFNFSCGSTYSGSSTLRYNAPTVSSSASPICSNSQFSVTNLSAGVGVTWSTSNSGLSINTSGYATVQSGFNGDVAVTATLSCGTTASTTISIGKPTFSQIAIDGVTSAYPWCIGGNIPYTAWQDHTIETVKITGGANVNAQPVPTFTLHIPNPPGPGTLSGALLSATKYDFFSKASTVNFTLDISATNACGSITQCLYFSNVSGTGESRIAAPAASLQGIKAIVVDNHQSLPVLSTFPNPTSSSLTIQVADSSSAHLLNTILDTPDNMCEVSLLDRYSRKVFSAHSSDKTFQISTEGLADGIYYLTVIYKDAVLQKQIVINR